MSKISLFLNKKILTQNNSIYWDMDDSVGIALAVSNLANQIGCSFDYTGEVTEGVYIAHVSMGDIDQIKKWKESTLFTSIKKIRVDSPIDQDVLNTISAYYADMKYDFSFIMPDNRGNRINTQVFGFCLNEKGECCIVRDEGEENWTLPGGGCEFGERVDDAFRREVLEEAQAELKDVHVLGYVLVSAIKDGEIKEQILQARLVAQISTLNEFIPHKDGFETCDRKFVKLADLSQYIDWVSLPVGVEIMQVLSQYESSPNL